jgi:hypothetical protein
LASIFDLALDKQAEFACEHSEDPAVLEPICTSRKRDDAGKFTQISAVGPIRAVYTSFFEQTGPPPQLKKLYQFFNYDWRLDIRLSGQLLWEFLQNSGDGEPWDIACHSQGGLVLTWASLLAGPAKFKKFVRRAVFLGVPLQGTLNAAEALVSGVGLLPGVKADAATVRTWPSVYMMLPRFRVHVPGATGVELFKSGTWQRAGLLAADGDTRRGLRADLLQRAAAWKRALDQQEFLALQSVERLVLFQGDNVATLARAPQFPQFPDVERPIDGQVRVRGDGLVPADRTLELLPPALLQRLDSIVSPVVSHLLMCASLDTVALCDRIFSDT